MGLDKNELPTDAHVPTQGQVARFSKTKNSADGPQLSKTQKLKLDVGTPNLASQWNREANRLLRKHFQAHYSTGIRVDNTELADAFKTHFKTVRENYLKGTAEQTETHIQDEADKKALRAEKTRLKTLLEQRVTAAEIYAALDPKLRKIISTIQTLPKEAMSEDEADHRSGSARYVVKKLEWRADDIDAFVGILDDLHKSTRFEANGSATRGKFPRARIRNTARPPVVTAGPSGLPSNFYDTEWVDSLPDLDRRALNMQGPLDLSFSPNILRHAARYHHIVDGSQPPLDINDPSLPPISGKSQDGWTGKRAANGKGKSTANGKGKPKGTKRAHTSTQAKR
ncbi:hypothetical protein R3P38DRAFT_2551166 [Favolaschia claudopus]|uniref:Uncharacterized protein n=1 Tax=Favolaschia claudopus TaxID=2862362 RepID=A0AAW0AH83_9AGAR